MDRILERLWLGGARDLEARVPLRLLGFVAVVDLRDGDFQKIPDVEVHRLGNRDGDPWSPEQVAGALDFIWEHVQKGKVLVVCVAGMSRSVSVVIGYLVRCGWSPVEAYEWVRRARPQISPVGSMLESVLKVV